MRGSYTALFLWTLGCAPPPEIAVDTGGTTGVVGSGDPSIRIVYPPDGEHPLTIVPDGFEVPECRLVVQVVIDVDSFEIADPGGASGNADGEGHWHLQMETPERSFQTVYDSQFGTVDEGDLAVGSSVTIRASLQNHDHSDLDEFAQWEDVVELSLTKPAGVGGDQCP